MKKYLIQILTYFLAIVYILSPVSAFGAGLNITYPGSPGPLLSGSNLAPGDKVSNNVTITNNNTNSEKIGFQITKKPGGTLDEVLYLSINKGVITLVPAKRLSDFYSYFNETEFDVLNAGASGIYTFTVELDKNVENSYQGKTETFDLSLGFIGTPAGPGAPAGATGNPLTSLGATVAGILGITIPSQTPEVTVPEIKGDSEVQGTEQPGSDVERCPWWFIVLIILALVLIGIGAYYYKLKNDNRYPRTWFVWPILAGVASWILHWYLHDDYNPTWYCKWFWALIVIELIVYFSFHYFAILRKNNSNE